MGKFILIAVFVISVFSCSKKESASGDSTDDSSVTTLMQSAATTVGEALETDYSAFVADGIMAEVTLESDNSISPFAACSTATYGACSGNATSRDLNGCTRTSGAGNSATFHGIITWTFSGGATCSNSPGNMAGLSSGSATRTVSGHYAESSSGYKIVSYTGAGTVAGQTYGASDLLGFNGVSYSGGWTLNFTGASTRTLNIAGVHRRGLRSTGVNTFWHTVFTPSPLSISVSSGTYSIASGTVTTLHNRAGISVSNVFTGVTYPGLGTCCYPTAGTITTTIGTGTPIVTTFSSTCGAVTVGSISTNLPACGGTSN